MHRIAREPSPLFTPLSYAGIYSHITSVGKFARKVVWCRRHTSLWRTNMILIKSWFNSYCHASVNLSSLGNPFRQDRRRSDYHSGLVKVFFSSTCIECNKSGIIWIGTLDNVRALKPWEYSLCIELFSQRLGDGFEAKLLTTGYPWWSALS